MQDLPADGAIFIVGLSRSGTKLLRDILNQHSRIRLPDRESYFIPHVLKHFAEQGSTPDTPSRANFIRYLRSSAFYRNMERQGAPLPADRLASLVESGETWPAIIESVFRFYTGPADTPYLWGDKTPKYLNHMLLLAEHFAGARFLHIYRDPRDRVLSANKAWGANIYISAQQWSAAMQRAHAQARDLATAYKTVRYEDLITSPSTVIGELCAFLAVDYEPQMLELEFPVERRGDMEHPTRKNTGIYAGNIHKYRRDMTPQQLVRIEEIVFPCAGELGYKPESGTPIHRPLTAWERLRYFIPHYCGNLRVLTRRWGLVRGLKYAYSRWHL